MDYNKFSPVYINLLKKLLKIFYNISDVNYKISLLKNGNLFIIKKQNLLIRLIKGKQVIINKNIFNILIDDFTKIMSLASSGNNDFISVFEEEIKEILLKYGDYDEFSNLERIIQYYVSKLNSLKITSFWSKVSSINIEEISNTFKEPDQNEDLYVQEDLEEHKEGLTYILDTFIWGLRKKIERKNIMSYLLSITLRVVPLNYSSNDLSNFIKNIKILSGFYSSKSPPYRTLPQVEMYSYNST